ncbi:uncharacterized protein ARMOST_05586 [Armillaria ostoyae]|uniref:Cytochrome P450 n=1 Tax=Armillaria ostoyae TaxID=47428 RepID=A0A284R0K8_ARMOS|nr:uncharacterized protein ARMOST_05586 [Armillaria ostoyae]
MRLLEALILALPPIAATANTHWPYKRYVIPDITSDPHKHGKLEFADSEPPNHFIEWLRSAVKSDQSGTLRQPFKGDKIPRHVRSFEELWDHIQLPEAPDNATHRPIFTRPTFPIPPTNQEALRLFADIGYPVDPLCTSDKTKWFYRTVDGSCNWMETGNTTYGQLGAKRSRDYDQYSYQDGYNRPRDGPNPRAVSNAFFKRKQRLYYEHTPLLLGLIEFIMHDVTYSEDSITEYIDVPVPPDEDIFPKNTTFRVWRTERVPGTGTSPSNPRENANQASTWLDVSSLYGSSTEVSRALRSFEKGKLLTSQGSFLPFNTMGLPMRTRPGVDPKSLFAGGDPRTNEDWIMLAVHTLLLRDHNRMCDLLAEQHPEYDDERLYQTVRLAMSAKFALIANSYQMAYWQTTGTDAMPWPRDDGFPLYRQMYDENALEINPIHLYPWPLVTKGGKPMVASAEMAVVYRFHEFIVASFPLKDAKNNTILEKSTFESAFDSNGFIEAGLENILRGIVATDIPNFKSGVDESFRSAGQYRGSPFDIVTWSIVHEREQGLPTFNEYFRAYNSYDPAVVIPIRERFEDFSSDPEMVANLKRLYTHPDEVDLVVGCQLEETNFPGTTVPSSALIISLFSLFGLGNSDRFSVGYSIMRCILVDKPWDCTPSNALDELFWDPKPTEHFPKARWLNTFWLNELDFQAHGTNLLWRLITENSDVDCLQKNPLFPYDPETNPILCSLSPASPNVPELILTAIQVILTLYKEHQGSFISFLVGIITLVVWIIYQVQTQPSGLPPAFYGWPIVGVALQFQSDPSGLLLKGMRKWAEDVFGLKLANQIQYVVTSPADMQAIVDDSQYEVKFSLHEFLRSINFDLIVGKTNFETDLHTKLIRNNLMSSETLAGFAETAALACDLFHTRVPLLEGDEKEKHYDDLIDYLNRYITFVISRCIVGPDSFDDEGLLETFLKFNDDAVNAMGLASLLPSPLRFIAGLSIQKDYKAIESVLIPAVERRRSQQSSDVNFLNFILPVIDNDKDAADMLAVVVFGGLTNLQATMSSTFLDIINQPGLQERILNSLGGAAIGDLSSNRSSSWASLRSAAFESLRLSGPVTGPARAVMEDVPLPSEPSRRLPKGQAIALTAYYHHRQPSAWGVDAEEYRWDRFIKEDPPIGSDKFVSWGLNTPHMCPGRWFALQSIQIMVKALLEKYEFIQDRELPDSEKYRYSSGSVLRNPVGVKVLRRS